MEIDKILLAPLLNIRFPEANLTEQAAEKRIPTACFDFHCVIFFIQKKIIRLGNQFSLKLSHFYG